MANSIDELLDRAIAAFNRGEVDRARGLAGEVLAADADNADATDLLAVQPSGEIRRLTVMFCDLVGSTEMSERLEPETYRTIVARYQAACRGVIERRYEGSIMSQKGDGILAAFGFPVAHENDADRGVRAGLDVLRAVHDITDDIAQRYGEHITVRIALHKGLVFLDLHERDLYGFAVNVAARLEGLAEPGTLLVSEEIRRLVGNRYELIEHAPRALKGVTAKLTSYTVVGENVGTVSRPSGPLIGRADHVSRLHDAWTRARDGQRRPGECVAVVGDAGMGKSRLVAELVDAAEGDGAPVVEFLGSPLETSSGLWPVRQFVAHRCGVTRATPNVDRLVLLQQAVGALDLTADAVPALATLLGIAASAGYEPVQSDARRLRDEIETAAFEFVRACFGDRAGVVVCEDAHWFDEQTRAFVTRLAQQLPPTVLTAVTSRDPQTAPRGATVTTIGVAPLEPDDALTLLRALPAGDSSAADFDQIVKRGDGIPLFLEELLRASGTTVSESLPPGAASSSAVPEVLYEALTARLNVSPNGSAVAAAAAVIGAPARADMLATVAELSAAQTSDGLNALLDARIVETVAFGSDAVRFRHELLREVAYDLQPPSRRRAMHARVAEALVRASADADGVEWRRVAGHYETAGSTDDAVNAYERASRQARQRGALTEARSLLSTAIDLHVSRPGADTHREVTLRLARGFIALTMEGHTSAEAAADYERCLDLCLSLGPSDEVYATMFSLWSYYAARAEFDRADQLLELVRAHGDALPDTIGHMLEGSQALDDFYRGNFTESFRGFAAQADFYTGAEVDLTRWWFIPSDPGVAVQTAGFLAAMHAGDLRTVDALVDNARRLCSALPFPHGPFTFVAFLAMEAWMHTELGEFDDAAHVVDEVVETADRYGFDSWAIVGATQRQVFEGLRILHDGATARQQPALSALAATIGNYMAMWKMIDQWVFVTYYTTVQGQLHAAAGEIELARAAFDEARAIARRTGMGFYESETIRHAAHLAPAESEKVAGIRDALGLAQRQGSLLYELHAALDLADLGSAAELEAVVAKFAADTSFPALERARETLSLSRS